MKQQKLLNKKIIISAAANGIGWSIALECMSNGTIVYITEKELAVSLSKEGYNLK